jgi:3-deoxy-7-phosphoheptulonate synthase
VSQNPGRWRALPVGQQPTWPDQGEVAKVRGFLATLPALTSPQAVRELSDQLGLVHSGRAFILQAGDCAEPLGAAAVHSARLKHRLMATMAEVLADMLRVPIVKIGRIAGQFAKPRSQPTEVVDGEAIPTFRGVIVNGPRPVAAERRVDPHRMLSGYHTARLVLDELALLAAGQADAGVGGRRMWASHEALLLDYEEAFVRRDVHTGQWYLLSTELPWIGERTRQVNGGHVALLATVANPVACKLGPTATVDEVLGLCAALGANRAPGRLTLIARMGAGLVEARLPPLVRALQSAGYPVIWLCDPMHGNHVRTPSGLKTRRVADIVAELRGFVSVMADCGQWPGGVHLEVAGSDVTECLWDSEPEEQLHRDYQSLCDGRLNNAQTRYVIKELATVLGSSEMVRQPVVGGSVH